VSETLRVSLIVGRALHLYAVFPIYETPSILKLFSIIPQSLSLPILQIWVLGNRITLRKGCLMRRSLLLFTGLALLCLSGCHFHWWHHKHHQDYASTNYDACGCDGAYAGSIEPAPIPLSHVISNSTGAGSPLPGLASPAPAGTKVSTPTNK
jgi:hypothetical protein